MLKAAPARLSAVSHSGFGTLDPPMFCVIMKIDKALVRRWYGVISAQVAGKPHELSRQMKFSYRWCTTTEARVGC